MKQCNHCQKFFPYEDFRRDAMKKDGHRQPCASCRKIKTTRPAKPVEQKEEPREKPTTSHTVFSAFHDLAKKFNTHFSLSVEKSGRCRFQVHHGTYTQTWKAESIEMLFDRIFD